MEQCTPCTLEPEPRICGTSHDDNGFASHDGFAGIVVRLFIFRWSRHYFMLGWDPKDSLSLLGWPCLYSGVHSLLDSRRDNHAGSFGTRSLLTLFSPLWALGFNRNKLLYMVLSSWKAAWRIELPFLAKVQVTRQLKVEGMHQELDNKFS